MPDFERTRQTLICDTERQLRQATDLFEEIRQSPYKQVEYAPVAEGGKLLYETRRSPFVMLPRQTITLANGRKLQRQPAVSLRLWRKHPEHTRAKHPADAFSFVMYAQAEPDQDKPPYRREELINVSGQKLSVIGIATRGFEGIFPAIRRDTRGNSTPENWLVFRERANSYLFPLETYARWHRNHLKLGKLLLNQTANALRDRKLNPRGHR